MQPVPSRSFLFLALLFAFSLLAPARAQNPLPGPAPDNGPRINVYASGARTTFAVAIPDFDTTGTQRLAGDEPASIIMNDLKLSGFFRPPDNADFARETNLLDRQKNTINFAEWNRIKVAFLIRGDYTVEGPNVVFRIRTYDTGGQNYVFGKQYAPTPVADARKLAHQVSDDIIKRLLDEEGNSRSKLVYIKQVDPYGKTKLVCVVDADGKNEVALTGNGELTATPCWGQNGTEVYYTTYKDFNPDLAGMILPAGGRPSATWWISRKTGFNLSPAWNETRKLIALTLTKDGNSELYTLQRDGQNLQRVTNNRAIDSSPAWSRDGSKIAFTSDRTGGGSPQIWIKDMQTGDERRLTTHSSYNDGASWSPAGPDRISFASRIDGNFQIFICNPDGTGLQQVTHGNSDNEDPTWAPNGLELAFSSNRSGRKQIYRMFADGANVTQITNDTAAQSPCWSPILP